MSLLKPCLPYLVKIEHIIFTFHYVSIKTTQDQFNDPDSITLHSTMSLLKRLLHQTIPDLHRSLHSTMSLLKPRPIMNVSGIYNHFTFHYVSIKTVIAAVRPLNMSSLHSTMSLLKHSSKRITSSPLYLYIPLCLY